MKTTIKTLLSLSIVLIAGVFGNQSTVMAQNTATIYILKNQGVGAIGQPTFTVNDVQVGELPKKSYYECTVPEGNIVVSVFYKNEQKELSIKTQSGSKYYVCADIKAIPTGGGQVGSFTGGGAASGFGRQQAQSFGGNMVQIGGISYSVNLTRINNAHGEAMVKKCKKSLVADLSDIEVAPAAVSYDNYAQVPVQPAAQPVQNNTLANNTPAPAAPAPSSDVDVNIPVSKTSNDNTFVLIIANENYEFVDDVQFALNDGEIFREYCLKTLGVPERQIWLFKNASLGIIAGGVDKMVQAMNIFDGAKAIVYYCGHGIPDEKTGDAYIVPVDGRGTNTATCYSLNQLYKTMASAKTSNVTYFMDACFTGANRDGSMLVAARGVAREAKKEVISGNTVVFSAASGDETAMPYKEKGHGLFTYFLLKKLQETKGDVTYGELADYINSNVKKEAFLTNDKPQNPVVATSEAYMNKWKSVKIK